MNDNQVFIDFNDKTQPLDVRLWKAIFHPETGDWSCDFMVDPITIGRRKVYGYDEEQANELGREVIVRILESYELSDAEGNVVAASDVKPRLES
jgi:hypothetical protein